MQELSFEGTKIRDEILERLTCEFGVTISEATKEQIYSAVALSLRKTIMEKRHNFKKMQRDLKTKEIFYLSFEFLMGKFTKANLFNTGLLEIYKQVLESLDLVPEEILDQEPEPGLGNGGLGRLAASFMEALATQDFPAYGCGIRYEYGLFRQKIIDGYQIEFPDTWLEDGNVWEISRPNESVKIRFGGNVKTYEENGKIKISYENESVVIAVPYDIPICGYKSDVINTLRLWSARSEKEMDFGLFSGGDYLKAVEEKALAEVLSKVLYPEDNHREGKALRLKQQYFFAAATIGWIVSRHKKYHNTLDNLPDKVVIHINDTHPALAIPELMRVLMDEEGYGWDEAWSITSRTFAYTNHTIMNEALEKWPMEMIIETLPRIWMILDEMNNRLVSKLVDIYGQDWGKINYMSIIAHGYINMVNLCLSTCFAINGVSDLHTKILTQEVFSDYYNLNKEKFFAITNGITFRRWLGLANPELSNIISEKIGDGWLLDSMQLKQLEQFAFDEDFQKRFALIKQNNKTALAKYILDTTGITVNINSIFDIQAKRLHEYKRQLLNILHILHLYNKIKTNPSGNFYPRTFIFAAKASPGYSRAKLIIKLITSVAKMINTDDDVNDKLSVVFIENYGVNIAEKIIPAADVSEQISTAGKEASGTGNMKFMLNGALTIGTMDGANIEMSNLVGCDNIYIFGNTEAEVKEILKYNKDNGQRIYMTNPHIKGIVDMLIDGSIDKDNPRLFYDLYQSLVFGENGTSDYYMVLSDFESYVKTHELIEKDYQNPSLWWKKSIINTANAGWFSSDRTIREYNENIWGIPKFIK